MYRYNEKMYQYSGRTDRYKERMSQYSALMLPVHCANAPLGQPKRAPSERFEPVYWSVLYETR
jgi:hypothetical protein